MDSVVRAGHTHRKLGGHGQRRCPLANALGQLHVRAGQVVRVLLKGRHLRGGLLGRAPHALQRTALPVQEPPGVVAVKNTYGTGRDAGARSWHVIVPLAACK